MEEQDVIRELSMPIYQSKGWLKLLGVMMIIQGVITGLTIVGIIICWLPIWLGVLLFQAASSVETAQMTGNKPDLVQSLGKLKTYFVINGVLTLVMLIGVGLFALFAGAGILATLGEIGGY